MTEEREDMKKPFCMKDRRQKLGKLGKENVENYKRMRGMNEVVGMR